MLMIADEYQEGRNVGPIAIDPGEIMQVKEAGKHSLVNLINGCTITIALPIAIVEGHLMEHMEHQQTIADRQLLGERVQ